MMYDKGKILIGLILFILVMTFPFYYNLGRTSVKPQPSLETPEINAMQKKQCVKPKEFMKAEHMQVLDDWRDSVVREGNRVYGEIDGKQELLEFDYDSPTKVYQVSGVFPSFKLRAGESELVIKRN